MPGHLVHLRDGHHGSLHGGDGKTFAALLLMLRHLLLGARLIVIDPQGNVDFGFLGSEMNHNAVLGTGSAAINLLDITHDEIGQQVEI